MTLSREQIEQMTAGPDLNWLVAVFVMKDIPGQAMIRSYSEDISAAWEVVERLTKSIEVADDGDWWLDGLGVRCCDADEDGWHGRWRCHLTTERNGERVSVFATADTPALVICRAALLAVIQ